MTAFVVVPDQGKRLLAISLEHAITLAALLGGRVESEEGDLLWSPETGRA